MPSARDSSLAHYRRKRDFSATPEPSGGGAAPGSAMRAFTVQRHAARRLHYDFRLELDGVLRSWAVPKGPSLDPGERRLAVEVEDHPLEYGEFEGAIPEGEYGAGQVLLWDRGTWNCDEQDPAAALAKGRLKFTLHGFKLHGAWTLVRMAEHEDDEKSRQGKPGHNWLLIKENDAAARHSGAAEITDRIPGSVRSRIAEMRNASSRPLPDFVAPQLATLVTDPPEEEGWVYEIKYDGYRLMARLEGGRALLFTRTGRDWTGKLPQLAERLAGLGLDGSWLDGEIAVLDPGGIPDFQALQNVFERGAKANVVYYVFDAPWLAGRDLRPLPLIERKERLAAALARAGGGEAVGFSEHFAGEPGQVAAALEQACRLGLEGLIGKQADAPYVSERSRAWIKLKCRPRQEFVVGGYTDPAGSREGFGALLLGVHDAAGKLHYAGRVGSGFEHALLARLGRRLAALRTQTPPFEEPPTEKGLHWVKPELVVEVAFSGWTRENVLRQASFLGLREDKPADRVEREDARPPPSQPALTGEPVAVGTADAKIGGVRLTHPERLVWPEAGITKSDLAHYYERIAPWLLPHLDKRPLSLLRCPDGSAAECFFQKHLGRQRPVGVQNFAWEESSSGKRDYVYVDGIEAVIGLVQNGIVEFHTWGSSLPDPGRPDRITLDLDPGPDVAWPLVVEGARLARVLFDELGLTAFLKTTGGKGLHLVAPLVPDHDWGEVKAFARALAEHLARVLPERFTANMAKSRRSGRIYADYLRNDEGATAIAAYSTRARPGAPVSVPLAWEELSVTLNPAALDLKSVPARLAAMAEDPWRSYADSACQITADMRRALRMTRQ